MVACLARDWADLLELMWAAQSVHDSVARRAAWTESRWADWWVEVTAERSDVHSVGETASLRAVASEHYLVGDLVAMRDEHWVVN
jgi:hypothetical protein